MKITDLKCAIIANSPVIRITTDEGIEGWGQIETPKPYVKPQVLDLKAWIVGQDPRNVERARKRHTSKKQHGDNTSNRALSPQSRQQ